MTQSDIILNRLCDLQGTNFQVTDVKVTEHQILWQIEHKEKAVYVCPHCRVELHHSHDNRWITIQDVPFGRKKCIWRVKRHRILCTCSLNVCVEQMKFRSKHHFLTQRLVDHIEEVLCSKMFTVADVARLFELDYGVVYKIDHEVLLRLIQEVQIPDPIHISVDEKSFKKGHCYVTIVTDTDTKDVIWVSPGNSKESLDLFFTTLGPERCRKILTVSKDLHKPYARSCAVHIPHAIEIADPFHVVQRLNRAIDDCRKELAVGSNMAVCRRRSINNMQWVLRYKKDNMQPSHLESLETLAKINEPLYRAYLHKEAFYEFFEFKPNQLQEARSFLMHWTVEAFKIGLKALTEFAEYLSRHNQILLNIVRTQRNSAISEGINRKISVIKSMAYGYRNIQYFMLKILQRCGVLGSLWKPAVHYPS
jgi:transposase